MHARTAVTIDKLRKEDWFRNVGAHDTEAAEVLSTWQEAVDSCASPEWVGLCHDAVNQYCAKIKERSPEDYERWNEVILSVRPTALALVREKTQAVIQRNSLPKSFLNSVGWDILHMCVESEFSDIYTPGFFASQAYWYVKGHFPCGWQGQFPRGGKLIIY